MTLLRQNVLELMACCAVSESLIREVKLQGSARDDKFVAMWFDNLKEHYTSWEAMPSVGYMRAKMTAAIQSLDFDDQMQAQIEGQVVLKQMEELQTKDPGDVERVGRHWLRLWMTELLAAESARKLSNNPHDTRAILDAATKQASVIDGVEAGRFLEVFPDNSLGTEEVTYERTGLDFIDVFCGGGLIAGEVVGHLAPSGQGKTTLVLQLAWSRVERALTQYSALPLDQIPWEKIPKVYVFAYEIVVNLVMNLMSNAAQIPRETCKYAYIKKDLSQLSNSMDRNYKDYEYRVFEAAIAKAKSGNGPWPPGELERFQRIATITNRMMQIADFSGANSALSEWSSIGVPGIRNYIQSHQDQIGHPGVDMVFVDYIGAMVDSMTGLKVDNQQAAIKLAPNQLSREVANRFKCPVWAAHQLNSGQNKKQGGTVPNPKDGDRCGMYHEQCAICLASGMLTKEGASVWILAKNRREQAVNMQVARLDGAFARWVNANKEFSVVSGLVVSTREVNQRPQGRVPGAIPPSSFSDKRNTGLE